MLSDGWPSGSRGQPSSPTTSIVVWRLTCCVAVPPCCWASSCACRCVIEASVPVNETRSPARLGELATGKGGSAAVLGGASEFEWVLLITAGILSRTVSDRSPLPAFSIQRSYQAETA